jgi:hypothetical protein
MNQGPFPDEVVAEARDFFTDPTTESHVGVGPEVDFTDLAHGNHVAQDLHEAGRSGRKGSGDRIPGGRSPRGVLRPVPAAARDGPSLPTPPYTRRR